MSEHINIGSDVGSDEEINKTDAKDNKNTTKQRAAVTSVIKQPPKKEVVPSRKKENKKAYMYLGPNLPEGILFTGGVHKEIPLHLQDVFTKIPDIKKLFVEVKDVPAFKSELNRQGSEAYRLCQNIERLIDMGVLRNGRV